jgi:hypothetical protein
MSPFPKLLFVGPGGCGKDTACRWFARHTRLVDVGPMSLLHAAEISAALGMTPREGYACRRNYRIFWRDWLDRYREGDPAKLVREAFAQGDVCNGVRRRFELDAARAEGLADLIIWIDNPGTPPDASLDFGPEAADQVLPNDGDLARFHSRLEALARLLGLEVFKGRGDDDLEHSSTSELKCHDPLLKAAG